MKNYLLLFIFFFTSTLLVNGQQPFTNQAFQSKYHMLDSSELYVPLVKSKSFTPTSPPPAPVRSVAEWEQSEAVLVSYAIDYGGFGIPFSLIAEMSQDCKVITIVESSAQQTTVTSQYNSNGVNMSNCSFYIAALDSYWIRDYGPWFIMIDNNEVAIVDFPYNRPRPNDDEVPVEMASYLNIGLYGMDIIHTGGNYMSDGMGIAASTDLVTDDNPSLTVPQINTLVNDFLGVSNYYITTDPLADYIKHIDCWGKFLDVDKVLITSVPVTDTRYADYEAMAAFWENEISSYGDNYQVFRVYEDNGQPYTNSYILNKKVFLMNGPPPRSTQNSAALAVYQQAMPGYEIFGISSSSWVSTDALHCRTHEVADRKMLYIYHLPLLGEKPDQAQYLISANIFALSDSSLVADSIWFKYRVNQGSWNLINMTNTGGNTWQSYIPQQSSGDTIEYYIHASDEFPKSVTHPLIGAPDPHKFWIGNSVSITEVSDEKTLVFPNPANADLFVVLRNQNEAKGSVSIYDNVGNLVKIVELADYPNKFIKLNVAGLAAGSYYVTVQTEKNVITTKVIIMH